MEDTRIIELFFQRAEDAVAYLAAEYGAACGRIAYRILGNRQDAEECVNDAYLAIWERIPPEHPDPLSAYLFRVVRNLALKKYHANTAAKRDSGYALLLDELAEALPAPQDVESEILAKNLSETVEDFLAGLSRRDRMLFVRRYWYGDTPEELAEAFGMRKGTVNVRLHRIRNALREYLAEHWG